VEEVGATRAAGAARCARTVRELPKGGRGTEGEGVEPGVDEGAGPALNPTEGEREETGGTTGEGV
jgi:hypothetical protein